MLLIFIFDCEVEIKELCMVEIPVTSESKIPYYMQHLDEVYGLITKAVIDYINKF